MRKIKALWHLLFAKQYFLLIDEPPQTFIQANIGNNPLIKNAFMSLDDSKKPLVHILNHLN